MELDPFALWMECKGCDLLTSGPADAVARKAVDHEESTGHTMTGGTAHAARRPPENADQEVKP
jgi:hypothetical protein